MLHFSPFLFVCSAPAKKNGPLNPRLPRGVQTLIRIVAGSHTEQKTTTNREKKKKKDTLSSPLQTPCRRRLCKLREWSGESQPTGLQLNVVY
ncbi:hypothetical protein I7I50_12095 [Histoplasma capsulatum G186AR]|uniref:Uncharacterized protein n=1 Tax=Ajellomyces capsulatus TaxID=5037 RepID=A0A8H7YDM6_AJECA|nr:hypothetical protein I7I52_11593 [Histoplasma capsulatum]QSS70459.1 hypothetical protein I7I50_12095 [Histoplasma capsulatum G186AR]